MRFTLILDYTGLTYFGHIPNTPFPPYPRIEEKDMDAFGEEFIDPVDEVCDASN